MASGSQGVRAEERVSAPLEWMLFSSDAPVRITSHRFDATTVPAGGPASELVQLEAGRGGYVYFERNIRPAAIIAELAPRVWVRSDRQGIQLLARVVLPRTQAPGGAGHVKLLVGGDVYERPGMWRQLGMGDLAGQLQREVRLLRSERQISIDDREAYVDAFFLNAYGGEGITSVWIGPLEIAGHVRPTTLEARPAPTVAEPLSGVVALASDSRQRGIFRAGQLSGSRADLPAGSRVDLPVGTGRDSLDVRLHGSILTADGQPFSPRAIVYRGESLAWLAEHGFNAVWLEEPPSPELAAEARQQGVCLIGPSPILSEAEVAETTGMMLASHLTAAQRLPPRQASQVADELERAKSAQWRPLVCWASCTTPRYCRLADILMVGHAPLGTSLELADEPAWLAAQTQLARPGTPCWAAVQSEPSAAIDRQMELLAHSWLPRLSVEPEQIRLLTYSALAAGCRGVVFQSRSRLDSDDPQNCLRTATLTLLNRELEMLAPWVAAGARRTAVETGDPQTQAVLLHLERAKLLIVLRPPRQAQFVTGDLEAEVASVVVPGIPPSYAIYRLQPTALEPLDGHRVTGGVRVALADPEPVSLVLLCGDPRAPTALSRSLLEGGRSIAEQEAYICQQMLTLVENVDQQLSAEQTPRPPQAAEQLESAQRKFEHSQQLLQSGDHAGSVSMVRECQRVLRRLRWQHWMLAVESQSSPVSLPFTTHFAMLPYHWSAHEAVSEASLGPNQLVGGDFEDLQQLLAAGWRHVQHADGAAAADVRLLEQPKSGRYALRLSAGGPRRPVERPPLEIISPPVACQPGQVVCIHCWVRATAPPGGGPVLEIETWPGGPEMAERVRAEAEWRELSLYRVVDDDGQVRVTFRLPGAGEAWIDEVSISPVILR